MTPLVISIVIELQELETVFSEILAAVHESVITGNCATVSLPCKIVYLVLLFATALYFDSHFFNVSVASKSSSSHEFFQFAILLVLLVTAKL